MRILNAGLDVIVVNYERAWAAGFFDGEGNISCYPRRSRSGSHVLQLSVTQIHRSTLERFHAAIGGLGRIYGPYPPPNGKSLQYALKVGSASQVLDVIELLWPWLSEPKKSQARIMTDAYWAHFVPPRTAKHGTYSRFSNQRCRCAPCTEAGRAYRREWWRKHHGQV